MICDRCASCEKGIGHRGACYPKDAPKVAIPGQRRELIVLPAHECVFVEEQEPSGRLICGPCLVCGFTALDALLRLYREVRPPDRDGEPHDGLGERLKVAWENYRLPMVWGNQNQMTEASIAFEAGFYAAVNPSDAR